MQQVTVRVPGTTSNFGPGFDCLGAALSLHNDVTVRRENAGRNSPMSQRAGETFFSVTGARPFYFSVSIKGNVPIARGLGSSVTLRLGVLHGLNQLARANCTRDDLFRLCAKLEGHPDNAAPASFGGFTIANGERVQRFEISKTLRFVLLIPDFEVATAQARRVLPKRISRREAVANVCNVASIAGAFASGDYEQMRGSFRDALHQPFRKKLVPFLDRALKAAEEGGALGAFLSGSGSGICALTLRSPQKIAGAMRAASELTTARTIVTGADNQGVRIISR